MITEEVRHLAFQYHAEDVLKKGWIPWDQSCKSVRDCYLGRAWRKLNGIK